MNPIERKFLKLKVNNEMALIVYLTAGYPTPRDFFKYLKLFENVGVDMIEIGIPFSDPIADGRTIQYASHIALKNKISIKQILEGISRLNMKIPLIVMTYLNPVLAYGQNNFGKMLKDASISGLIVPDLPFEEMELIRHNAEQHAVALIPMIAPTTVKERITRMAKIRCPFIYCVSVTGTTGVKKKLPAELPEFLSMIREFTCKPMAVGFGIASSSQIKSLRKHADGVVIGSRIIEAIIRKECLMDLLKEFKQATRR